MSKTCRLCLAKDLFVAPIFSEYGARKHIKKLIFDYLQINVDEKDQYSHYICYSCLAKLEKMQRFHKEATRNQSTLQTIDNEDYMDDENIGNSQPLEQRYLKRLPDFADFNQVPTKKQKLVDQIARDAEMAKDNIFAYQHQATSRDRQTFEIDVIKGHWEEQFKEIGKRKR